MREQQKALIDAVVGEMVERGYADLTVESVVARAGISRSDLDPSLADEQALVGFAYETLFQRFVDRLVRATEAQASWTLKVKVGIGATLDMAAADPVKARFLTIETMATSRELLLQRFESHERLARLLAAGRAEVPYAAELPGVLEQTLVAGIAWAISSQLRTGESERLPALAPQLVEFALTPYLGRAEAAAVARRPRPGVEGG